VRNATVSDEMRVAGIAVRIASSGRPAVRIIVADDASGSPVISDPQEITSDHADLPEQLHDAAESVRSRLKALNVERVVVRRADRPTKASNKEGPRVRLIMEGAVTSAARSEVIDTRLGTGKDTGAWYGGDKATVDAEADRLLTEANVSSTKYLEATSAALAALRL
jgi:hypothetical protein